MLDEPVEAVRARAARLAELVGGEVEDTVARVGGGALPLAELPSAACAVEEELAEALRLGEPPVVALVRDGRTLLDCRTLTRRGGGRGRCGRARAAMSVVEIGDPAERSRICAVVLRDLPDWFGIEEATAAYIRDVAELPTFAVDDDAFIALKTHNAEGRRGVRHGRPPRAAR